jgi:hypothetical protein
MNADEKIGLLKQHVQLLAEITCQKYSEGKLDPKVIRTSGTFTCHNHSNGPVKHAVYILDRRTVWGNLREMLGYGKTNQGLSEEEAEVVQIMSLAFNDQLNQFVLGTPQVSIVVQNVSPIAVKPSTPRVILTEEEAEEFYSCCRKRAHLSFQVAHTYLVERTPNLEDFHIYSCDHCEYFHIGHPASSNETAGTERHYRHYRDRVLRLVGDDKVKLAKYMEKLALRRQYQAA